MSLEVDYLPVATGGAANVDSQANFSGSGYQQNGFSNGIAQPYQANKIWRQASMIAACIANFISAILNINILDDGNLANLVTNFTNAVRTCATQGIVSVPMSATPNFDASLGTKFVMVLSGNVTSSTLVNVQPGQTLTFIIKQDGTGGHTFVPPANLPLANIDTTANAANVQKFEVDNLSNVYAATGLVVN